MIRTLIFDADGPLYQRGATVTQSKIDLLRQFGYQGDHGAFEGAYDKEKFRAYDQSETEAVMFSKIMAQLGVSMDEVQAKAFTSQFNEIQARIEPAPNALGTLKLLHDDGYKVCILTDSFFPAAEKWAWFKSINMATYIDEIVSSYDIKTLKSTRQAYKACLNLLDTQAANALFVGHQQYEMDGAKEANIVSVALLSIAIPKTTRGDYNLDLLKELPDLLARLSH